MPNPSPTSSSQPLPARALSLAGIVALAGILPLVISFSAADPALRAKGICLGFGALAIILGTMMIPNHHQRFSPLLPPLLMLLLAAAAASLNALQSREAVLELLRWTTFVALVLAVATLPWRRTWSILSSSLVLVMFPVAGWGLLQYLLADPLGLPASKLPGSFFGYRNVAAMFLVLAAPVVAMRLLRAGALAAVLLHGGALALALMHLAATRTRSAWLGMLVAALVMVLLRRAPRSARAPQSAAARLTLAAALLAGGLVLLAPAPSRLRADPEMADKSQLWSAVQSALEQGGDKHRFEVWSATLRMLRAHPWRGVGLGQWSYRFPRWSPWPLSTRLVWLRPHNDWLGVAAETGLLGVFALGWLVFAVLRVILECRSRLLDEDAGAALAAAAGGLAAIGVMALFSFPRERPVAVALSALELGLIGSLARTCTPPGRGSPGPPRIWSRLTAILLLAGLPAAMALAFLEHSQLQGEGLLRRAIALTNQNRPDRAAPLLDRALQRAWTDRLLGRSLRMSTARNLLALGRLEEAERTLLDLLERDPEMYRARLLLAEVRERNGDPSSAADGLRPLLDHPRAGPDLFARIIDLLLASGRYDEALVLSDRALRVLGSEPWRFWERRGVACAKLGRWRDALDAYRRCASDPRTPRPEEARLKVAAALWNLGRWSEARREVQAVLEQIPGHPRALDLLEEFDRIEQSRAPDR
jgi:O-antigen ligase/Flp pilus assembly protein TadD